MRDRLSWSLRPKPLAGQGSRELSARLPVFPLFSNGKLSEHGLLRSTSLCSPDIFLGILISVS